MPRSKTPPTVAMNLRSWLVPRVRPIDLAREANVSHQYVYAVLAGKTLPSRKLLDAARRLGLPVELTEERVT